MKTDPKKKALIQRLSHLPVSHVRFDWKTLSLRYDGKLLKNRVKIIRHEGSIGWWYAEKNVVRIDDNLEVKDIIPVLVHECVEKYIAHKYKLNIDNEAHPIAERVEMRFYRSSGRHKKLSWQRHQKRIARIWRAERRYHLRKSPKKKHSKTGITAV